MKKVILGLISGAMLLVSLQGQAADTATVVTIKERPVVIRKEGDVYIAPAGMATKYYTYSDGTTEYVCSVEPVTISGITASSVIVKVNSEAKAVNCYPSSYFVVQAP